MAFKMKRPIIKGSVLHKQAKSVVSQEVSRGDSGLVGAAQGLGRSRAGSKVDYTIKNPEITFEKSKKKELTEEEVAALEKRKADREAKKEARRKARNDNRNKDKKDTFYNDVDGDGNVISRGYQSIKDKIRSRRDKKDLDLKNKQAEELDKRFRKAESNTGLDSDLDFSQMDNQELYPAQTQNTTSKTDKYTSKFNPGTKESEELLSRTKASRNKKLQDAAKKYNVKVKDLEAKEIDGKREFFPKQGAVGGGYGDEGGGAGSGGTQWDDDLGRFRIPFGGISEEAVQNLSPKEKEAYDKEMDNRAKEEAAELAAFQPSAGNVDPNDINSTMINDGNVILNPTTNTYEYTDIYRNTRRIVDGDSSEKTNNELPQTLVKPRKKDYNTPTQHFRAMQEYYKTKEGLDTKLKNLLNKQRK